MRIVSFNLKKIMKYKLKRKYEDNIMEFITSDGVRLEYDDIGQGEPILIMTGYAGYKEIWRSQVELLSHKFR